MSLRRALRFAIVAVRRRDFWRLAVGCTAISALTGTAIALIERGFEHHDFARLTTDDTFGSVGKHRIRYRLEGQDLPGPSILLISGLGGTIEQWHVFQPELAAIAPVLTYDRGGTGFSDATDVHSPAQQAEELHELVSAIGLAGPFVVVAYSASALMAREFGARYPELAAGLVFLDPIPPKNRFATRRALLTTTVEAFFGVMRVKMWLSYGMGPTTRREEKEQALLASFHHWLFTTADLWMLGEWTGALMATPPFGSLPIGVVSTYHPTNTDYDGAFELSRELAWRSERATFRAAAGQHSKLVESDIALDVIMTVEKEARTARADLAKP